MKRLIRSGHHTGHTIRKVGVRLTGVAVATGGLALMGFGTIGSPLASGGTAAAAPSSDNKEDIFLQNVGNPCCPGHQTDPHLTCTDINVWGEGMVDPTGTYTVDGWAPSGSGELDYPTTGVATWNYSGSGLQIIDVINVHTLISNAIANGDTPQANGSYHFKIQLLQEPFKHKTFWIDCPPTTTTSSTTSSTSSTHTTTNHTTSTTSDDESSSTSSHTDHTTSTTHSDSSSTQSSSSSSTSNVLPVTTSNASTSTDLTPSSSVLAASVGTPSTGADAEFGVGLALALGGAGLLIGGTRIGRRKRN